jgi:hypothetical protein
VAIVDVKYPKKFEEIYRKMYKTKAKSEEGYQLFLSSIEHDFALLRLEKPVQGRKYPTLVSGFREEKQNVIVCGYSEPAYQQYYQIMHSNPLLFCEQGGKYNIDTTRGQSGSPVLYMKQEECEEVCLQVAIHKGYDKINHLNVCTLLTKQVVGQLREWMVEMGLSFRVNWPEEKKEPVSLEQKLEEKSKEEEIAKLGEQLAKERKEMSLKLEEKEQELQQMRTLLESVLQEKSEHQPQPKQSQPQMRQ